MSDRRKRAGRMSPEQLRRAYEESANDPEYMKAMRDMTRVWDVTVSDGLDGLPLDSGVHDPEEAR